VATAALASVLPIVLGSCSDSSPAPATGGGCVAYTTPPGFDPKTPMTSFARNVMPLFDQSCSFSSCHGSTSDSKGNLFLGAQNSAGADAKTARMNIVSVMSQENPTMPYVTPGDPSKSYLMHKMDGDQCLFESSCTKPDGCQSSMPQGLDPLPVDQRDIVRRWIAQGAQDN
jgi:hypothetical protein